MVAGRMWPATIAAERSVSYSYCLRPFLSDRKFRALTATGSQYTVIVMKMEMVVVVTLRSFNGKPISFNSKFDMEERFKFINYFGIVTSGQLNMKK